MIWLVGPPLVLGWRTKCLFWLFACCSAPSDQAAMTGKTYQRLFTSEDEFLKLETVFVYFFSECFSYWLAVQGEIKFAKMKLFNRKTWTNFHGALEVQISHLALKKYLLFKCWFWSRNFSNVQEIWNLKDFLTIESIQLVLPTQWMVIFTWSMNDIQ